MYLLDTNVVSELRRPRPHAGVVASLASVPDTVTGNLRDFEPLRVRTLDPFAPRRGRA